MKYLRLRLIGVGSAFPGFIMSVSSLAYGDSLVNQGYPCNTNPTSVPLCMDAIYAFWAGVGLVGIGVVITIFLGYFQLKDWLAKREEKDRP